MKIFKYHYRDDKDNDTQIWVCNACKKANWEKILLKAWKLIDCDNEARHECALCAQRQIARASSPIESENSAADAA